MRFNACNPCCTNLPAWLVYHSEVVPGMHVIQVAITLQAYNANEIEPSNGVLGRYKACSYLSYLFFDEETTDDNDNVIWSFKNCPNVEGNCTATMRIMLTNKEATGKCAEQVWIKAAHVIDFEYTDSEGVQESGDYSTFKLKFNEGKWVNTSCHLVDVVGRNYLNLTGSLGLEDGWKVKDYNKSNSQPNPSVWFTTILCPKAGTVNYVLTACQDPFQNTTQVYLDSPIGDFSIGAASPGSYWMVGTTPPNTTPVVGLPDIVNYDYTKQDDNGFYFNRWSLNTFGLSCGFASGSSTSSGSLVRDGVCQSYTVGWNSAFASMQTNPLYLDAACGYGYWFNGAQYYNYWPWQYFWGNNVIGGLGGGSNGGFPQSSWGWGSWNYGWWWNLCETTNPGAYYAWEYGYWWGGPFYAGGLGGSYWTWWGTYPCYAYINQPYCWWWGYGYSGWWGVFNWWWWGTNSPYQYLGDWVSNTQVPGAFDAWYATLLGEGFENGTCQGYGKCEALYNGSPTTPLKCYAKGTRPITITIPAVYKGESGRITMKGDVTIDSVAVSGTVIGGLYRQPIFSGCTIGSRFTGSLKVTGLVTGTCDVTFDFPHGGFLTGFDLASAEASDITMSFFGGAVYTKPDSTTEPVFLNGSFTNTHLESYPYNTYSGTLYNGSFGDLFSGDLKLVVKMKVGESGVSIDSGMDFADVDRFTFTSTLEGDTYYSELMWKRQNCQNNIQCIPKHPVLGQVNTQHHDADYTYIYQTIHNPADPYPQCFLLDIVPTIRTYCYGLGYFDPSIERHALGELTGEGFVRVSNPPLDSYAEIPWDGEPCHGSVEMAQQVVLVSDGCLPMGDE